MTNGQMTSDRNLLTDKELHYVKDFMSWELLAMKKYADLAGQCEDKEIQQLIREAGRQHLRHFETLLSELKS